MSNARVLGQHVLWFPSCVVQVVIPVPKLMFSVPLCSMLHKFFLLVVSCIYSLDFRCLFTGFFFLKKKKKTLSGLEPLVVIKI